MCTLVLRTASHPVHPGDSCDIIDVMDTLKEWKEDPNGYWPPDTPKPDTWNGGRTPRR